jgi:hypothetical protein
MRTRNLEDPMDLATLRRPPGHFDADRRKNDLARIGQ